MEAATSNASAQPASSVTTQTPLPSYPPRVVFSTTGKPPTEAAKETAAAASGTTAVPWAGHVEPVETRPHHGLVLRVHEGVGARTAGVSLGGEGVQVVGRDVLVVEGHHGAALGDLAQGGEVAVVADERVAHDLGRGHPGPSASSRSGTPRPTAAWAIMRASWPPPMTASTGVAEGGAVTRRA